MKGTYQRSVQFYGYDFGGIVDFHVSVIIHSLQKVVLDFGHFLFSLSVPGQRLLYKPHILCTDVFAILDKVSKSQGLISWFLMFLLL